MTIQDKIDSITKNINYVAESVSFLGVKDLNTIIESGYQNNNILKDIISLRHYYIILTQFQWYLISNQEEPDWDIDIRTIVEQSYGLIVHHLGLEYQWSNNDN